MKARFFCRVVRCDREGYYYTDWSKATPVVVTADNRPFSVNDFRELLPEVRNCLISHRLRAALNAGVLVKVGKTPSTLKSTHAHEINVYRGVGSHG